MDKQEQIKQLAGHLFRENSGKMVAVLSRMFGVSKIEFILDVVQDTFEQALLKWRFGMIPDNPSAWLMKVAKNKALNTIHREKKLRAFSPSVYQEHWETNVEEDFHKLLSSEEIADSQLRLLLSCCHSAISTKNQIIITLNILCGFGVSEISRALLLQEEAVKKALTRTRASLKNAEDLLQTPSFPRSDERLSTVRTILYLMFNEGHKTTRQQGGLNHELCYEAIRLTKLVENSASYSDNETSALLSLMFFNLSRFSARLSPEGEWLPLEEQDRSLWNSVFIEEGFYYLKKASHGNTLSRFHLEAIISSLHCSAATFEETDWKTVVYLYQQLEIIEPTSPLSTLNRIIAQSYLSLSNCMEELEEIEGHPHFKNNFILPITKGDFYRRRGDYQAALQEYQHAFELAKSPADKKFLKRRICECELSLEAFGEKPFEGTGKY